MKKNLIILLLSFISNVLAEPSPIEMLAAGRALYASDAILPKITILENLQEKKHAKADLKEEIELLERILFKDIETIFEIKEISKKYKMDEKRFDFSLQYSLKYLKRYNPKLLSISKDDETKYKNELKKEKDEFNRKAIEENFLKKKATIEHIKQWLKENP